MAVKKYPKKSGVKLSDHFTSSEFDCPCSSCVETLIDEKLVELLTQTRSLLGLPLRINSGYRCSAYQSELRLRGFETAQGISQHELGRAADIMADGETVSGGCLETYSRQAGFKAVGVGNAWVHVDLRGPEERRWTYTR